MTAPIPNAAPPPPAGSRAASAVASGETSPGTFDNLVAVEGGPSDKQGAAAKDKPAATDTGKSAASDPSANAKSSEASQTPGTLAADATGATNAGVPGLAFAAFAPTAVAEPGQPTPTQATSDLAPWRQGGAKAPPARLQAEGPARPLAASGAAEAKAAFGTDATKAHPESLATTPARPVEAAKSARPASDAAAPTPPQASVQAALKASAEIGPAAAELPVETLSAGDETPAPAPNPGVEALIASKAAPSSPREPSAQGRANRFERVKPADEPAVLGARRGTATLTRATSRDPDLAKLTAEPLEGALSADAKGEARTRVDGPDAAGSLDARSVSQGSTPSVLTQHAVRGSPETVANLAAQIVKKLEGRSTHFDVELDPAGLGKVGVRIQIGATGHLSAAMMFETPQAASELRARANELRQTLEQAGFNLSGGLSFDVAGDRGQARQQWTDEQDGKGFRGQAFQAALDQAGEAADSAVMGALRLRRGVTSSLDLRI